MSAREDFSADVREFKKLPVQLNEDERIDSFVKEHNENPSLREHHRTNVDSRWHTFLAVFFIGVIVAGLSLGSYFLYLVSQDHFKVSIDQPISTEVTVNNTEYTTNNFDNNFENTANVDASIIIETVIVNCNAGGCNGTG